MRPGDRLPSETELLAAFGVSRSTLREALRILAARDLVEVRRGVSGGTFIAQIEASAVSMYLETSLGLMSGTDSLSVKEIVEARELIEVPCARFAAERATREQIAELRAAARTRSDRDLGDRGFEVHKTFHSLLVQSAGNRLLGMMADPNFRVLRTKFRRKEMPDAWWREVDADHVVIAEHVANGQGSEAADAVQQHLEKLRELYLPVEPDTV
jgi:DNA-binding FadR family transcriptional regulator